MHVQVQNVLAATKLNKIKIKNSLKKRFSVRTMDAMVSYLVHEQDPFIIHSESASLIYLFIN